VDNILSTIEECEGGRNFVDVKDGDIFVERFKDVGHSDGGAGSVAVGPAVHGDEDFMSTANGIDHSGQIVLQMGQASEVHG